MTGWETGETKAIFGLLEREDLHHVVVEVVETWNDLGLLGIDLADALEKLVHDHLEKHGVATGPLEQVYWGQLAEHYAMAICGVDEDELSRRRVQAAQSSRPRAS
jgi:hypothetical protein